MPRQPPTSPAGDPLVESCPHCGEPIRLADAYCLTCGMSRGLPHSTPREAYLRACVAALELIRQTSQHVRPLVETRRAEILLETAIEQITAGISL